MARPLRLEYPGAVYHVMARGQERGVIFRDDEDRGRFLGEVAAAVTDQRWVVHAYCLMTNHYHLLVETPEANLSVGMQVLNGRYSQAYNVRHRRKGHFFEDRYKAIVVEKESYLLELCRYVVLNPVRAGMVRTARDYRWTNYRATAGEVDAPEFLEVNWTLACFGKDIRSAREKYRRFVADGMEAASPMANVTGQVFLGRTAFLAEMKDRLNRLEQETPVAIPRAQRQVGFVDLARVVAAVAAEYGVAEEELGQTWRRGEEKAVAVYLARRLTGLSGSTLGKRFGVSAARVSQLVKNVGECAEPRVKKRLAGLEKTLRKGVP